MSDRADAVTAAVSSSSFMVVMASLGALGLIAFGLVMPGGGAPAYIVTIVGVLAAVVVAFDMPLSTSFDREGIVRRCMLRKQRIRWDDIDKLGRTRPIFAVWRRSAGGGLVASIGRRQYLLADRREPEAQLDALIAASGLGRDDVRWSGLLGAAPKRRWRQTERSKAGRPPGRG